MRVALVDPIAYTPPYDDALAAALAARGHDVTLLTGPFLHGEVPAPRGYAREELFLPLSGRLFRNAPRSRDAWPQVVDTCAAVVVHSERAVEELVDFGADRARIVRIPHPVFRGEDLAPAPGRTLLFFGLIR